MSRGLETTWKVLASSRNEAAADVLLPALEAGDQALQEGALRALLQRRTITGQRQLLARWHSLSERWMEIIVERPGRLSSAIRDAILGADEQLCKNGCAAILSLREYDLMPALITAAQTPDNANASLAAETLGKLAGLLYDELANPRESRYRRDPHSVRTHVVAALELSVRRYPEHQHREVLNAFLMLTGRENATLKRILQDPLDPCHVPLVESMMQSPRPGVMRLLLSFLDDPQAPKAAIGVLTRREDRVFVGHLMNKIGFEPSNVARLNLKRITAISWLRNCLEWLPELNDVQQHAMIQAVMHSGLNRLEKFEVVRCLLKHGNAGGRRAAAAALIEFQGADANQLVLEAIRDEDPHVQAHALSQMRRRGLPGAMSTLISKLDSPHEYIRAAVRNSLSEFRFARYLAAFDILEEEVRRSTGQLVKKVDPETPELLLVEMTTPSRNRRLRGIRVAVAMELVTTLEDQLIAMLADDDHMVRTASAAALSRSTSVRGRQALEEALHDSSVTVQQAAQVSLETIARGGEPPGAPIDLGNICLASPSALLNMPEGSLP